MGLWKFGKVILIVEPSLRPLPVVPPVTEDSPLNQLHSPEVPELSSSNQSRSRGLSYSTGFLEVQTKLVQLSSMTGDTTGRGLRVAMGRRAGEVTPHCGLEYLPTAYLFKV